MNPDEIRRHFGIERLNMLYDCILQNPAHELANWILSLHDEKQIAEWIMTLKQDQFDEGETNV